MGREGAVGGAHGPAVGVPLGAPGAHVDHGLDGQHHPLPQHRPPVGGTVVGDLRVLVHLPPHSVPHVLPHHRESLRLHVGLDGVADGPETRPCPGCPYPPPQGLLGDANEALRLRADAAHSHCHGAVGHEPPVGAAQVDADDVPFLEGPVAGDAVHDLVVHRDAHGSRIPLVAQEGGNDAPTGELPAHQLVQLLLHHSRAHVLHQHLQDLGHVAARLPHNGDLLVGLDDDGHVPGSPLPGSRHQGEEPLPHGLHRLLPVHLLQLALAPVVLEQLPELRHVHLQSGAHHLRAVVLALVEPRAIAVADARHSGRSVGLVVNGAASGAVPSPRQAAHQLLLRDPQVDGHIDALPPLGEGLVQRPRLGQGAGKAVQQASSLAVGLLQPLQQHSDGDLVGHQSPRLHVRPRPLPQLRAAADVLAEQLAGGDVGQPQVLGQKGSLGALAGPRQTQQHQEHVPYLANEAFVLAHQQLGLDLAHGVQHHSHHDDEAAVLPVLVHNLQL